MLYKIRRLVMIVFALMLLLYPFSSSVNAQSRTIYESLSEEIITSGASLENIVRFTDEGWYNINILRVDLSNPYIEIDTLTNNKSIKELTSVKDLALDRNAVAAINGSFYNPLGSGMASPDGPVVQSGDILSAYAEYNRYGNRMASFSMDDLGQVLYKYWRTTIGLVTPNGNSAIITQYNKHSYQQYNDYTIIDNRWSEYSIGASKSMPDIVEVVVDDEVVKEIRQGKPPLKIPENGYVLVTRESSMGFINNNIKVGDKLELNITTNPDWSGMKMAVSGSSVLVENGRIPSEFSLDTQSISAKNPRTVIGSSRDGKQLMLVTIDGRQNSSVGMTQMETAEFMKKIGAYNALNLDGGGSSTLVARTPGTKNLEIVNSPSDGTARLISNAIGIFSVAPPSSLEGLIIDVEDENIFVNTSRKLTVRGYDKYFNPVQIDPRDIEWSVSGIKGTFKENSFCPVSIGEAKITARIGDASGSINISSLSSPVELTLDKKIMRLPLKQSDTLKVTGKNVYGYSAIIEPQDMKWSVSGNIGSIQLNRFTASSPGTGYISASTGDTHAYCAVAVASNAVTSKEGFETINGAFASYPDTVSGSYDLSDEQKHSENFSGKLTYDFSDKDITRAAYMVFADGGRVLDPSTVKIGLWVYNTHENTNWLRAEIYDTKGVKHLLTLTSQMDWTGWKYVEASVDSSNYTPLKLTRIYLTQFHSVVDTGEIYMDDLTITASGFPAINVEEIPKDTKPIDEAYKRIAYQKNSDSFRFAVFGQSGEPRNPLENLLQTRLYEKINNYIDVGVLVGDTTHEMAKSIEKPVVITEKGYKSTDIMSSRLLQIDTSKDSLRKSNIEQWHWLLNQLKTFKGDNLFIFLKQSPDSFSDRLEGNLFKETLTEYVQRTHKNVWVFYKGSKNESYMERGVKYITTTGFDMPNMTPENADVAQYILVTVVRNSPTFEFKAITS